MRYAISYVSTANKDLQEQDVNHIMDQTRKFNKSEDITGILLYNERNFFQLIEGEEKTVKDLYKKILLDTRHEDIIQFLEKIVSRPSFDGYLTDFITDDQKYDRSKLEHYLHYIEVLNPESRNAVKRVIELMMV